MTEVELPLGDHVQKAKFFYDRDKRLSGMSFYIKKYVYPNGKTKVWFCTRYYPTFDRPDWTYYIDVNEKEADDIVAAGYATYWDSKEKTFG